MMKKLLSIVLALIMTAAIAPVGTAAGAARAYSAPVNPDAVREALKSAPVDENEIVTLIVKLKGSPAAKAGPLNTKASSDMIRALTESQAHAEKSIAALFTGGAKLKVNYRYQLLFNGFSIDAPRCMIDKIAALDEVERVSVSSRWKAPEEMKTEPDKLSSSIPFIGADVAWAAGLTGKGTAIAVLDTGAVVGHNAFKTAPAEQKLSSDQVSALIAKGGMHCAQLYSGELSASDVYYSGKIPFKFDYAGHDADVSHADAGSDHGTHVAGIAAGYYSGSSYTGVAKDAQLIIMKVYGANGETSWDTVMAALEDAAILGADAANLSFGAGCGYTSDDPDAAEVFALLSDLGCNISVAAGNDGSDNGTQYYGSAFSQYALAMNPDNGVAAFPGTYTDSVAVACCQKNAASMLNFSSHGSTADLKIKPDITAPGYNIYSATDANLTGSTTGYGPNSGTSMSAPHIAGSMALLTNYVASAFPDLSGREKAEMVNRLLMCTAVPVSKTSPRAQGSGIVNIAGAISTKAYITVEGCPRPKLELGDDPNKTGVYTLSFNVVNFGGEALSYTIAPTVLTEGTTTSSVNGQTVTVLSGTARSIKNYVTVSGNTSVTVPANSTQRVTLTLTLKQSIKSDLDSRFPHGIYIDGEVVLDGDVDLVVPYLAFYGNWNEASMFDRSTYIDEIQGINNYNIHTYQTAVGALVDSSEYMLFGANPYISCSDWLSDRCTISPNGDGCYDRIDKLTYDLIRNAGEGGIRIYNEDTGEVYLDVDLSYTPKAWNYNDGDPNAVFIHSSDRIGSRFTSWAPDGLEEGTHLVFLLYHYLDNPGFTPEQNECAEIRLPMTVDTTAPVISAWNIAGAGSSVTVHDEHYAAWVAVYADEACTDLIAERAIAPTERGAYTTVEFNAPSDTVYVVTGDYGRNTSAVTAHTGNGTLVPVELESMTLSPDPVELLTGHTALIGVNKTPADANNYDITWSVADPGIVSVAGSGDSAELTGIAEGCTVVTATATDKVTKSVVTASAAVTVYGFTGFRLVDHIEDGGKYVIVAESSIEDGEAFAVGNTSVKFGRYLLPVAVTVSDEGFCTTDLADEPVVIWNASGSDEEGYSFYNEVAGKYIDVNSSGYLYPGSTALKWFYDNEGRLDNRIDASGYYYLSYVEGTDLLTPSRYTTSNAEASSSLAIRLYKLTYSIPEPVYYTVTFTDWDGSVIASVEVAAGGSAQAPADPVRTGYTFTGWDPADFTHVTGDMTVTATYAINSYRLTIAYVYDEGGEAAPAVTADVEYGAAYSVTSPVIEGYTADVPVVEGVMGAEDVSITVTYNRNYVVMLLGDVDCNGVVDIRDVTTLNAYLMNCGTLSGQGLANADADSSNDLTAYDSTLIMMLVLGMDLPTE